MSRTVTDNVNFPGVLSTLARALRGLAEVSGRNMRARAPGTGTMSGWQEGVLATRTLIPRGKTTLTGSTSVGGGDG